MEKKDYEFLALAYHEQKPKGKICVNSTKPLNSQEDLSLAYSPGVAGPCRKIASNQDDSFNYTTRGNLVGVISNGTAVLGLGNIGPYAAKPVMEGKGMLFKKFADIDVFDIEIAEEDPEKFIAAVKALEPTFGGINLEDIKAPECFYIEERLKKEMSIPVFHDDQHGTAIIASAALINALEITGRKMEDIKVVFSGAGAAAISTAGLLSMLGVQTKHILMCDSKGVLHKSRDDLNSYKERYVTDLPIKTLEQALKGADVFIGVSSANIMTEAMLLSMAPNPIIFALANPDPEVKPEFALRIRPDAIIATGRSDYPNQVNNVLGFPYIFRGALDVRATTINNEMKLAAVHAIAKLAKESVPEEVMTVYHQSSRYQFGRDYLIPKPVDQRVLLKVAPAVAKAAMDTGVARINLDLATYEEQMTRMLGTTRRLVRSLRKDIALFTQKHKKRPKIVLPFGSDHRVLKAAKQVCDDGEVDICLLGKPAKILQEAKSLGIQSLEGISIIDPSSSEKLESYAQMFYEMRKRKGVSRTIADQLIQTQDYFAAAMVRWEDADGMINGVTHPYPSSIRPILETIGITEGKILAGVYLIIKDEKLYFFSDCSINIDPSAEELAQIAMATADLAKQFIKDPVKLALLSFASFGASTHPFAKKMAKATQIIKAKRKDLECEGEMQADVALNPEIRDREFPFCDLKGFPNVLIFPDLASANISYKLLTQIGGVTPLGPILVGLSKPAYVMQRSATVSEIVNMIYVSAYDAIKNR